MKLSYEENQAAFHEACGFAIREWAALEATLYGAMGLMLGLNDQFRCRIVWFSLSNWGARRRLLTRLAETYLAPEPLRRFTALVRRADKLAGRRNLIAHALGADYGPEHGVHFLRDGDGRTNGFDFAKGDSFSVDQVHGWGRDINRLAFDFKMFEMERPEVFLTARIHRDLLTDPEGDA